MVSLLKSVSSRFSELSVQLRQPVVFVTLIIMAAAFLLLRCVTQSGIIVTPDSATYLSVAESAATDVSLVSHANERLSHFPPGYSVSIAAFSKLSGFDVRFGSPRMLNALLFAVFIGASFSFFSATTQRSEFGAFIVLLFMTSSHLVLQFANALSEAPFIAMSGLATFVVSRYLASGNSRLVWIFGCLIGYAFLLRFVGIVWIVVYVFVIAIRQGTGREKLRREIIFLLTSMGPMILWLVSRWWVDVSSTNRTLRWHPISFSDFFQMLEVLVSYFFVDGPFRFLGGLMLVALLFTAITHKHWWKFADHKEPAICFVVVSSALLVAYCSFLLLSRSLFDRATPFDTRLLAPVVWMLIPAGCLAVQFSVARITESGRAVAVFLSGACFLASIASSMDAYLYRMEASRSGEIGLNSELEKDRRIHRWLADHSSKTIIYTNKPWMPYLASKVRPVVSLPLHCDYTSGAINTDFDGEREALRRLLEEKQAVAVYWTGDQHDNAYQCLTLDELKAISSPNQIRAYDRFVTFGIPELQE